MRLSRSHLDDQSWRSIPAVADGITDAENSRGEFFGDDRLEEAVRDRLRLQPAEFANELLSEMTRWRPASAPQQDDITLVVVDVVDARTGDAPVSARIPAHPTVFRSA